MEIYRDRQPHAIEERHIYEIQISINTSEELWTIDTKKSYRSRTILFCTKPNAKPEAKPKVEPVAKLKVKHFSGHCNLSKLAG